MRYNAQIRKVGVTGIAEQGGVCAYIIIHLDNYIRKMRVYM